MSRKTYSRRAWSRRMWMCEHGLHWPIKWAKNASYGPVGEPEPGWCCHFCGEVRYPYRRWLWWPAQDFLGRISWWLHGYDIDLGPVWTHEDFVYGRKHTPPKGIRR